MYLRDYEVKRLAYAAEKVGIPAEVFASHAIVSAADEVLENDDNGN